MGWTIYSETIADPKAECDRLLNWTASDGTSYRVLKSEIVGSTHYAAVQMIDGGKARVFASIILLEGIHGGRFGRKEMSEDMGPYARNCPAEILDLLSPLPEKAGYAAEWRADCRANLAGRIAA